MNPAIEKELREQLDRLPTAQQRQVLDFVRALTAKKRQAASGQALKQFAGTIAKEDLALIAQAIDDGCEQVNPDDLTVVSRDEHFAQVTDLPREVW
jgi:hypothetical protein